MYYDKQSKNTFMLWPNPFKAREKTYGNSVKKKNRSLGSKIKKERPGIV